MYGSIPLHSGKREIRLLRVLPADFPSPLECELSVASLDRRPSYKALSYVWGDPSIRVPITVNGRAVAVTVNLERALRRLRAYHAAASKAESLVLWVDAVCIDQGNPGEVGEQVALMGHIYKLCTEVCVWLGPLGCEGMRESLSFTTTAPLEPAQSSEGTQDKGSLAMMAYPKYEEAHDPATASGLSRCAHAISQLALGAHVSNIEPCAEGTSAHYPAMLSALQSLATNSWFDRAWVVQEGRLAPRATVYAGNVAWDGATLWSAHAKLHQKRHTESCPDCRGEPEQGPFLHALDTFFVRLLGMVLKNPDLSAATGEWDRDPTGAIQLLLEFSLTHRQRKCFMDRDRLYAYLGIAESVAGRTSLVPDMALTAAELYAQVCTRVVAEARTLTFLAWDTRKNRYPELPSWVVDWTHVTGENESMWMLMSKRWTASQGIEFAATVEDGNILVVQGTEIDRVAAVGEVWSEEGQGSLFKAALWTSWHDVVGLPLEAEQPYPAGGTYREAWWKALCFVSTNAEYKFSDEDIAAFEFVATVLPHNNINFDYGVTAKCRECKFPGTREAIEGLFLVKTKPIWGCLPHFHAGRRIFKTEKGYVGFGRASVQVGNRVFLLGGCSTPVVMTHLEGRVHELKKVNEGETRDEKGSDMYELVSDVYVYGIMDGELIREDEQLREVCIG